MLNSLTIQNFKSVTRAKLEFGLVNLFIGPNGAGKSNLLEAIGIVSAALGRGVTPQELDYKGIRLSLPHLFKSTFKNRKIPKTFGLSATIGCVEYSVTFRASEQSTSFKFQTERLDENGRHVLGRGPRGAKIHRTKLAKQELKETLELEDDRGVFDALKTFANLSKEDTEDLEAFSKYVIYTPQTAVMRGLTPDTRQVEPLGLTGSRMARAFKELLDQRQKFLKKSDKKGIMHIDDVLSIIWKPGWANSVRTAAFDSNIVPSHIGTASDMIYIRDKYMKTKRNYLSPYDASEGTLYLIFVATLLAHENAPKYFALDNVDGTLNPGLVRNLLDHIVKIVCEKHDGSKNYGPRQIFLTSHNPTALDALDIFDPAHKIFVVRRNEVGGGTEFVPLLPPEGMTKKKWIEASKGKNLSRLWLDERFPGALG